MDSEDEQLGGRARWRQPAEHEEPDVDQDGFFGYEEAGDDSGVRRPGARRAVLITSGVVFAALLTVGGVAACNLVSAVLGGSSGRSHAAPASAVSTSPPNAARASATAEAFLAAWARGDLEAAGALTDRPDTATAQLADFKQKLAYTSLALAAGGQAADSPTTAGDVTIGFKVTVTFAAASGNPWTYQSGLSVRQAGGERTLVHWDPSVIHPLLTGSNSIVPRAVSAQAAVPVDRKGRSLDGFRSLAPLLASLRPPGVARPADPASANGQAVVVTDGSGGNVRQLYVISQPPAAPQLRLTLDADVQGAAEAAVAAQSAGGKPVGLVAIEPSTGNILAVANAPAHGFNQAFLAQAAPGSTMKVITAAALLEAGDTPDTSVPCPQTANSPRLWHNDEGGAFLGYTLADDFAQSCNTAFIQESQAKLAPGTLPKVALEQFGLGLKWSTAPGVSSFDAKVPAPKDSDDAAGEAIGLSEIQANPLAMASVAATVQSGTFHQPILLSGQPQVAAARSLPSRVAAQLRAMMAQTAASGTARQAMAGLSGQVGAKTGTADVAGAPAPNSWFIGYRGDLAVAAEVDSGGHGAGAAGQAAAQVLAVGNGEAQQVSVLF